MGFKRTAGEPYDEKLSRTVREAGCNSLTLPQSNHDVGILNALVLFFGFGYLKPKYNINDINEVKDSRIVNRFVINQYSVVIDFLDKYPLLTRKYLDYVD